MLNHKPRRRLFYPIGWIGLAVGPLLWMTFLFQRFYEYKRESALEVSYWSPAVSAYMPSPLKFVNDKFMKISLDGSRDDQVKLAFARLAIRELVQQPDTTQGIEFTFKPTAKYASLVALFDVCQVENVRAYANYRNKFWVFNLRPDSWRRKPNYPAAMPL
jgi:hypothetical protein